MGTPDPSDMRMGLGAAGALHRGSPQGGILPSVLLWDQLIWFLDQPMDLQGFVPAGATGNWDRFPERIHLSLQFCRKTLRRIPTRVPGAGPVAEQLQSLQEALD